MTDPTQVPQHERLQIDYDRPGIPISASILRPVIYIQGGKFHCFLGPNPENGIVGCGETPEKALQEWDENLTRRLELPGADDELKNFVQTQLRDSPFATTENLVRGRDLQPEVDDDSIKYQSDDTVTNFSGDKRKFTTDGSNVDGSE